jgi:hypothetical protein
MGSLKPNPAPTLLAPLYIGDRLPWKLDGRGEPQWVTVIEVVSNVSYLVRCPDGAIQLLVDSE